MSLHGLLSVTMGVPNVAETAAYYADFGLTAEDGNWFATTDGGRQLRVSTLRRGAWLSCASRPTTPTTWLGRLPAWAGSVCPRKLGHAVMGSTGYEASMSFFSAGQLPAPHVLAGRRHRRRRPRRVRDA